MWPPGLIEDTEEKELKGLVEERVKALHFHTPQVRLAGRLRLLLGDCK